MEKVAIYIRVSTLEQAESGYSIDGQISKLKKFCEIKDWKVYNVFTDPGYSGSNMKRPALKKLINGAKNKHFDTVLVYKLDRLSRSQKDTLYLIEDVFGKNDVDFVSLNENFDTSTSFGKAMIGILSVFSQLEREQITERMQLGKLGRAKAGKPMSWANAPFGYDFVDDKFIVNKLEASIIKRMFEDYKNGVSITKLKDHLNEEGHIGKNIQWSYRTVRQILDNSVYAGYITYRGKQYEGQHEKIISRDLYFGTQKELKRRQIENAQRFNPRPFQSKYMLSGKARCGYCGAPLKIMIGHRTNGEKTYRYQCKNRFNARNGATIYNDGKKCDSGYYYMKDLEKYVLNEIEVVQLTPDSVTKFESEVKEETHEEEYKQRITQLEKKQEKLSDLYMNDLISMEQMQEKAKALSNELSKLKEKLDNIEVPEENEAITFLKENSFDIHKETYEKQKSIVNTLINKVDVTADTIQILWNF